MKEKDMMLDMLRNLALDRVAVTMLREDIAGIEKDEKQKELPAVKREALVKERVKLESCLDVTLHHISRMERLLAFLSPEERAVLDHTLINPRPEAVLDLAAELCCEPSRVYRIRARAVNKLIRLRYGAGE